VGYRLPLSMTLLKEETMLVQPVAVPCSDAIVDGSGDDQVPVVLVDRIPSLSHRHRPVAEHGEGVR